MGTQAWHLPDGRACPASAAGRGPRTVQPLTPMDSSSLNEYSPQKDGSCWLSRNWRHPRPPSRLPGGPWAPLPVCLCLCHGGVSGGLSVRPVFDLQRHGDGAPQPRACSLPHLSSRADGSELQTPTFDPKMGERGSDLRSLALGQINPASMLQSDLPGWPDFSLWAAVLQTQGQHRPHAADG